MTKQGCIPLLLLQLFSIAACAEEWPTLAVPENGQLSVAAENMVVNGIPMRSWTLRASETARDTLDFYRQLWEENSTSERPGYTEQALNHWQVLSRLEGDYLITVQVDNEQSLSTFALVGISKLPAMKSLPILGKEFPTLGHTTILNDIHATDLNKQSRTLVATSNRSMRTVIQFYQNTFEEQGWVERTSAVPYAGENEFALIFDHNQRELSMTFSREANNTALVAVYVEK